MPDKAASLTEAALFTSAPPFPPRHTPTRHHAFSSLAASSLPQQRSLARPPTATSIPPATRKG